MIDQTDTFKILTYKPQGEEYGFELFSARFGEDWDLELKERLFIYYSDFGYLIDSVVSVYPLTDPDTNDVMESFDVCGMNWIHNKAWDRIISDLETRVYEDVELKKFIDSFCIWIAGQQECSDEIMVNGTM